MRTLSSLIGRHVVTQSGLRLGRCHDLRAELSADRLELRAICVGRWGAFDRLGVRTNVHGEVPWSSIVRIDGSRIVVRDP